MNMPLTTLWAAPLIGAVLCAFLGKRAKYAALAVSALFLGLAGAIAWISKSNAALAEINELGPVWAYVICWSPVSSICTRSGRSPVERPATYFCAVSV